MRCDVASSGPHEIRAFAPSVMIPNADFIRCDISPAGRWAITYNWQADTWLNVSWMPGQTNLGPHNGNNCHYVRRQRQIDGEQVVWRFHIYRIYTPDGKINKVAHYVSDGGTILQLDDLNDEPPDNSQGILDVTPDGQILFWPAHTIAVVDGCNVRDPLSRGIYTICTFQDTYLGASVFVSEGPDHGWYHVYEGDIQGLVPRIAENGTAALAGVGFITKAEWLTRKFDPHGVTMPPVESVPLLNRVFGFECYTFHDAQTVGNLTLPVRPTVKNWHGVIAPSDRPDIINDPQCWSVYAGENGSYTCEQAIKDARPLGNARKRGLTIYQDSFPLRDSVLMLVYNEDIVSELFILGLNESVADFKERCRSEYAWTSSRLKFIEGSQLWPTVNVKGEASSAADAFIAVTQLAQEQHWPGLRFFAVGRDDVPMAALQPYVNRFKSGITGVPPARILPAPEDDMSIAYGPVMTGFALGELKEHADGPPYFKVVKPNGKVLCVTPDGHVEEREVAGPWERFEKRGNALVAQRDLNGKPVVYVLSLA